MTVHVFTSKYGQGNSARDDDRDASTKAVLRVPPQTAQTKDWIRKHAIGAITSSCRSEEYQAPLFTIELVVSDAVNVNDDVKVPACVKQAAANFYTP